MPSQPAIRGVYERNLTAPATGIDWRSASAVAAAEIELPSLLIPAGGGFMAGGWYEFACTGRWGEADDESDTTWRVYHQLGTATAVQLFGFVCEDTWPDSDPTIYAVDSQFEARFRIYPHDYQVPAENTDSQTRLSCRFEMLLDRAPGGTSIVTTTLGEHHVDPDGSGSVVTQVNGPSFSRFSAHKLFNDIDTGNGTDMFAGEGRIFVTFEKEVDSVLTEVYNASWTPHTHDRAD